MIKPGAKIGGRTVLRAMHLPAGRKPKFDPKTEMIWEFPAKPGSWIVCTLEMDDEGLDAAIECMEEIVASGEVDDLEGAIETLADLRQQKSGRGA